ncbi:MAG: hypothetical protein ACK4M0_04275 [Phreatobacter sp.]
MSQRNLFAFVLMPFEKAFDDVYQLGIKAAASACDVLAERVDEQFYSETMLRRIYQQIEAADFIIADVTGRNPNVMYEVGYAHAKDKICTLLTQRVDDIPFDLRHHRHVVYSSVTDLLAKLTAEIEWITQEIVARDEELFAVAIESFGWADVDRTGVCAKEKFGLAIDITGRKIAPGTEIEAIYLHAGKGLKFFQSDDECVYSPSELNRGGNRFLLKSNIQRVSPGTWTRLILKAEKILMHISGAPPELAATYTRAESFVLEIRTSRSTFKKELFLEVKFDEIPF